MAKCPHRFKIADIVAKDHTISTIIKHLSLLVLGCRGGGGGGGGEGHYLYGQPLQLGHKRIHN